MTDDPQTGRSRPGKNRVVGSRPAARRPRRLAGSGRVEDQGSAAPSVTETLAEPPVPTAPTSVAPKQEQAVRDQEPRLRTTWVLVAAVVVLTLVACGEIGWLVSRDDPVVSSSRPVVTDEVTHRAATDAAQRDVVEIFTYSYRDFDARIAKATSLMTPAFAQQFRKTAEDVKADFVANKTQQLVKVRGTSVVRASDTQVQALIFLDQYVTKKGQAGKGGAQAGTDYTPFRALVTMVRTEHGWLVDNIDTT